MQLPTEHKLQSKKIPRKSTLSGTPTATDIAPRSAYLTRRDEARLPWLRGSTGDRSRAREATCIHLDLWLDQIRIGFGAGCSVLQRRKGREGGKSTCCGGRSSSAKGPGQLGVGRRRRWSLGPVDAENGRIERIGELNGRNEEKTTDWCKSRAAIGLISLSFFCRCTRMTGLVR